MTLVVAFLSHRYAALATDRRITWQIGGASRGHEDTENKTIVLMQQVLLGYTGFARFDNERTDERVHHKLLNVPPEDYLETLRGETESAIGRTKVAIERSGHAFIGVGFPRDRTGGRSPNLVEISNALGLVAGEWNPRRDVRLRTTPLGNQPFLLRTYGARPPTETVESYRRTISRYVKRQPGRVLGVLQLMVGLVRDAAAKNESVGSDVQVSVLPVTHRAENGVSLGPIVEPVTGLQTLTLQRNLTRIEDARWYMPTLVQPGTSVAWGEVRFGTADPIGPRPSAGPPPRLLGRAGEDPSAPERRS